MPLGSAVAASSTMMVRPFHVIVEPAERAEEVDIEASKAARARAEELLKEKQNRSDVDFAKLQAIINRETAKLKVADKYRRLKR